MAIGNGSTDGSDRLEELHNVRGPKGTATWNGDTVHENELSGWTMPPALTAKSTAGGDKLPTGGGGDPRPPLELPRLEEPAAHAKFAMLM